MSQRRIAYFASACAAIALSAADGPVGAEDFDVENFHPVSPGDGELMAVQSTRQAPSGQLAMGLSFGVVDDPLVVVDADDDRVADVVSRRASAELSAAYGLGRVELAAALPFILYQSAEMDSAIGVEGADSGGVGDLRVGAKSYLVGGAGEGPGLGASLMVTMPTSVNAEFGGDAVLIADWRGEMVVAAANLGGRIRQSEQLGMDQGALEVGSAFTYGGGAGVRAVAAPIPIWARSAAPAPPRRRSSCAGACAATSAAASPPTPDTGAAWCTATAPRTTDSSPPSPSGRPIPSRLQS
jgi:hypothetical protein